MYLVKTRYKLLETYQLHVERNENYEVCLEKSTCNSNDGCYGG